MNVLEINKCDLERSNTMRKFFQKFGWISALIALLIIVIVVIFSNANYFSLNSPEKKDISLEKEESEEGSFWCERRG